MNQYCKNKRKTIVLQMDISGKTNQKQLYALYADRDNENDLENLGGDSDTEFIRVTEEVREALITLDNNIEVEGSGDCQYHGRRTVTIIGHGKFRRSST